MLDLDPIREHIRLVEGGPYAIKCPSCGSASGKPCYGNGDLYPPHSVRATRLDASIIPALIAEVERLRGIVERVRELHPYEVIDLHESPGEEIWCPECQFYYPCQTIRALEGE